MTYGTALCVSEVDSRFILLAGNKVLFYLQCRCSSENPGTGPWLVLCSLWLGDSNDCSRNSMERTAPSKAALVEPQESKDPGVLIGFKEKLELPWLQEPSLK